MLMALLVENPNQHLIYHIVPSFGLFPMLKSKVEHITCTRKPTHKTQCNAIG